MSVADQKVGGAAPRGCSVQRTRTTAREDCWSFQAQSHERVGGWENFWGRVGGVGGAGDLPDPAALPAPPSLPALPALPALSSLPALPFQSDDRDSA